MDLASMLPRPDLASTRYTLANPGDAYLVYQPGLGPFAVNLQSDQYDYEWFNPRTSLVADSGSFKASAGNMMFSPPFAGNAVLLLRSAIPGR